MKRKIVDIVKNKNINNEIFWNNEIRANKLTAKVVLIFVFTTLLIYITDSMQTESYIYLSKWNNIIIIGLGLIIAGICFVYKGERKWIKYMMIVYFELAPIMFASFSDASICLITLVLPVIISSRYYDESFTFFISLSCIAILVIMFFVVTKFDVTTTPNLNYAKLKPGLVKEVSNELFKAIKYKDLDISYYSLSSLRYIVLPFIVFYVIVSYIGIIVARAGKAIVIKQDKYARQAEKISSELRFASKIQNDMLPKQIIDNEKVMITGKMLPAKEVGGDFYDYFVIDEDHIAIVIGDVSDKGVPAALFMSKCKTLINGYAKNGYPVDEIYNITNVSLCENNDSGMFVTSFLGILNIKTGLFECANAGHCLPVYVDENGNTELLDVKPNLFLAGMDDEKYNKYSINLSPGSRIMLYTDGVSEAMDKDDNQYGEIRLLKYVNANKNLSHDLLIENLYYDINDFVNGAEQHDDITVLVLDYKKQDTL